MPNKKNDTIVAIATPPGQGAIGIVRLSGPASADIARLLFHSSRPVFAGFKPYHLHHGQLRDGNGNFVDEVLAVGDVRFRKKCMKRMEELLDGGTTLLFVSHNIEQVRSLCTHALWLDHGDTVMSGPAKEVCAKYIEAMEAADVKESKDKKKTE